MCNRDSIFDCLKQKLVDVGFLFEKKQKPFMQPKRGWEYKFIHPQLVDKLKEKVKSVRGRNFYIKQLSDDPGSEIGLVNGKTTALKEVDSESPSNCKDTFDGSPAWVNKANDPALDKLLSSIKNYLNHPLG